MHTAEASDSATLELLDRQRIRYKNWLIDRALPLWWERGTDRQRGGYFEALNITDGTPAPLARRARVQARQCYSFAVGGSLGWNGPWQRAALHGLEHLDAHYRRPDGLYGTLVSGDGATADSSAKLYDQAFVLLACAWIRKTVPTEMAVTQTATRIVERLVRDWRHPSGGFREAGTSPFVSNPHMHLLEAALAWSEVDSGDLWRNLADEIVALCQSKFICRETSVLLEHFDETWSPLPSELGEIVEPGHQFEWAWLLERWARSRSRKDAHELATQLFAAGTRGVDGSRNVAVDEISRTFEVRRATARLWPQTERLKAALLLAETNNQTSRRAYLGEAAAAAESLWAYLQTPVAGLWRDKMRPDGGYVEEPAPASSFYHIVCAIGCLLAVGDHAPTET